MLKIIYLISSKSGWRIESWGTPHVMSLVVSQCYVTMSLCYELCLGLFDKLLPIREAVSKP